MASSIPILSEDQLLCSICLDVFTDPVSTSCGHNFCKSCLTGHWDNSDRWKCPLCNKIFENRPDLSVNTFISETATLFKKSVEMKAKNAAEENPNNPTKVTCDACTGPKMKSVKMCLNCGISYCETHLEPHKNIPILKKHTLIDPVENLVDYICKKHEKPLELFCRDDQTCVCLLCTVTDHKTHNTVPIQEASEEVKTHMKKTQTEVHKMIQHRLEKTEKIKESLELSKKSTEDETAGGVEVFTALIRSIERSQAELLEVMEEKQKAVERQAEEFIKDLEQEITELKRRDTELEQLSHTEDRLHLLQIYTFLSPSLTTNCSDICVYSNVSVETVRQLQRSLNEEFTKTLKEIRQPDTVEVVTAPMHSIEKLQAEVMEGKKAAERRAEDLEQKITELNRRYNEDHLHLLQLYTSLNLLLTSNCSDFSVEPHLSEETVRNNVSQLQSLNEKLTKTLQKIRQPVDLEELKRIYQHKDVTLDPDTAHPNLILSDDRKQVRYGDKKQKCPDKPERFDKYIDVLGNEEFSSGRFYYEVQVRGKTNWQLGVARESVNRKGETNINPQNGFWAVDLRNENEYKAFAGPPVCLFLREKPQKVGVFVDYEKGLVSFYDVEARSHIYSFTGQSFTEKLYPYFCPGANDGGKNSAPLIITPVSNTG